MDETTKAAKRKRARLYDRAAPTYDQVGPRRFARFGRRLVELAQIPAGARVLDVAAGRGAVLFPAAEQISPDGYVVGVDLSGPMAHETAAEIQRRGLTNAGMVQMNGEHLGLADRSFDALLCSFAIFWFIDPQQALAEFRRVLRAGGRLGIAMSGGQDPRWSWHDELLRAFNAREPILEDTGPSMNGKPDELRAALLRAGFTGVRVTVEPFETVYADAGEWWATLWTHGSRAPLERMSPDLLNEFKREAFNRFDSLKGRDGFHETWLVAFGLALAP